MGIRERVKVVVQGIDLTHLALAIAWTLIAGAALWWGADREQRLSGDAQAVFADVVAGGVLWLLGLVGIGWSNRRTMLNKLLRRRADAALNVSEKMYRSLFETANDAVYLVDGNGRYLDANLRACTLTGHTHDELTTLSIPDLLAPESLPDGLRLFGELVQNGRVQGDLRLQHKDGRKIDCELSTSRVGPDLYQAIVRDISERKRSAEALEESEARFRRLAENAQDMIYRLRLVPPQKFEYVSPAATALTGYTPSEFYADPSLGMKIVHADDLPIMRHAFASLVPDGKPIVLKWIRKDGQVRWIEQRAAVVVDDAGKPVAVESTARDITERRVAEQALETGNGKLALLVGQLEQRGLETKRLSEMSDLLQSCATCDEAYPVVSRSCRQLFAEWSGVLYVLNSSRNLLEAVASWGVPSPSLEVFEPDKCWGLRRGRVHTVGDKDGLLCQHLMQVPSGPTICVPMVGQGDTLGVLYLESNPAEHGQPVTLADGVLDSCERLAVDVAERLSLAIANLMLRETLRGQAIRDPLTGLFNRRYMEETLRREVPRALRIGTPLSVVMLDIDHFKSFNDLFGHDAGDALLHELGIFLLSRVRDEDVACRYGGEEFALILPDMPAERTHVRLNEIREGVRALNVVHRGQPLGPVTISLGVAFLREHGSTGESLLRAADTALYRAKQEGRDRVVQAAQ